MKHDHKINTKKEGPRVLHKVYPRFSPLDILDSWSKAQHTGSPKLAGLPAGPHWEFFSKFIILKFTNYVEKYSKTSRYKVSRCVDFADNFELHIGFVKWSAAHRVLKPASPVCLHSHRPILGVLPKILFYFN